jgi:hypothetical protein
MHTMVWLREPVAEGLANIRIPLADEVVGGCEAGEVGHGLQVPDDDGLLRHGSKTNTLAVARLLPPAADMPGSGLLWRHKPRWRSKLTLTGTGQ